MNITQTKILAEQIRLESLRSMASEGKGHIGGALSSADLVAVLYQDVMRYDPSDPDLPERDRLIFSKGHCGPVLYAALALKGYFPMDELSTLNRNDTRIPSHCNAQKTPGIDISTGSLGQGASLAAGIALGMKLKNLDTKAYLVLGDGECNEGQVWEMAMFAAQFKLDNLIAFIDRNHQQLDGYTSDIIDMGDLAEKFRAFGWETETVDGHDIAAIYQAIQSAGQEPGKPVLIQLETVKGKGWSKTEGKPKVHHLPISSDDLEQAEQEIIKRIEALKGGSHE